MGSPASYQLIINVLCVIGGGGQYTCIMVDEFTTFTVLTDEDEVTW